MSEAITVSAVVHDLDARTLVRRDLTVRVGDEFPAEVPGGGWRLARVSGVGPSRVTLDGGAGRAATDYVAELVHQWRTWGRYSPRNPVGVDDGRDVVPDGRR